MNTNSIYQKIKINNLIEKVIPKPNAKKLKGQNGIIGVIGGSFEYTGAPYYSAVSALKSGADLSHVFCHVDAAIPIKSYSPELIVHPGFDNNKENFNLLNKTIRWFKSMDVLLFGPGMGREDPTSFIFNLFLSESMKLKNMIHVLDADSLWHFMNSDYKKYVMDESFMILTPNKTEFGRLFKIFFDKDVDNKDSGIDKWIARMTVDENTIIFLEDVKELENSDRETYELFKSEICLSNYLKNKILIKKGKNDIITDGESLYVVSNPGALKRTGGLGDILGGVISSFCAMIKRENSSRDKQLKNVQLMEGIALASYVCRMASYNAYCLHGYSLTAPDAIVELSKIAKDYKL